MSLRKNIVPVAVGADPEFLAINHSGIIIGASSLGYSDGQFGCDGDSTTFELRPDPSRNPLEVVANIAHLLKTEVKANRRLKDLDFRAGSYYHDRALGGHIHFGIPSNKIQYGTASTILSNYVGAITALIEDKGEGKQRRSRGYGGIAECRTQNYGFEYRTCSSWVVSPYVAMGVLCLGKTVMYEVLNNPTFQPRNDVTNENIVSVEKEKLRVKFPAIWADITKMELYQEYKPYIDFLYWLVINERGWFPVKKDMKAAWGIIDFQVKIPNKKIDLAAIWGRYEIENATRRIEDTGRPVIQNQNLPMVGYPEL